MSGHSKWKTIQHKKGKQDAIRGKEFAKLSKEIFVAAKAGSDPETNAALRLAIEKAKIKSMPKDNIKRAIEKAAGTKDSSNYEEITYEGYGPEGVAIMVYCLTDNRNRTAASVRSSFTRKGGNLGSDGSVAYLFERKGLLVFEKDKLTTDYDEFEMYVIDLDILDIEDNEQYVVITTSPNKFEEVKKQIDSKSYITEYEEAKITMLANTKVEISEEKKEKFYDLLEQLEDNEDVQEVYHNLI